MDGRAHRDMLGRWKEREKGRRKERKRKNEREGVATGLRTCGSRRCKEKERKGVESIEGVPDERPAAPGLSRSEGKGKGGIRSSSQESLDERAQRKMKVQEVDEIRRKVCCTRDARQCRACVLFWGFVLIYFREEESF